MEYRTLPHGGEKISVIGLGAGSLSSTKEVMVAILNIDTTLSYKITHKEMIIPAA